MLRGPGDFLQIKCVCCGLGVFARAAPVCCNALGHGLDLRWQGPAAGYLQTCRQCFSVELGSDHLSFTFVCFGRAQIQAKRREALWRAWARGDGHGRAGAVVAWLGRAGPI